MAMSRGSDSDRCQHDLLAVASGSDLLSPSLSFPLYRIAIIVSISQPVGSINLIYVKHLQPSWHNNSQLLVTKIPAESPTQMKSWGRGASEIPEAMMT